MPMKLGGLSARGERFKAKVGKKIMNVNDELFGKYQDESGESYYCPVNAVADDRTVSEWELDNCVEVSTAARYAGHLSIIDSD